MKKSNVSVIIPIYNEENYILRCLDSLAGQTLAPMEIIVVDDGSTDSSKVKTQKVKLQLKTQNLLIFGQKHRGPGSARNLGAKEAKGEILVFVDADMYFDRRYLEKLVKPIIEGKAVATFTKEEYVANSKNIWSQCWSINSYLPINLHIDPAMPDEASNFRAILRKTFFQTKGYQDVGYGEDVTVLRQLEGVKAKVAPGAICYHFNPSSLSEVFISARWMGRGENAKMTLTAFLTYSFLNSLRKGILESIKQRNPSYLIFKIVFDLGILIGMMERWLFGIYKK